MATTGLHFWSTTAATNATADSSVNWAEGQAPSSVNDSNRAMMASLKKTYLDFSGNLTTGGSSTAYTITTNQVFADAAAMSGAMITFIPHTTSGAAPTLAVDGLTARQIRTATGTNVPTGGLIAGTPYTVTYVHASTEFILHQGLGVLGTIPSLVVSGTASVGGTFTATGAITATGGIVLPTGSFGTPSLRHSGDLNTGIFFATDEVNISAGGVFVAEFNALGLDATGFDIAASTISGPVVATQAQQETGTAVDVAVTPGRQHFHSGAAKAWGKFAGADAAVSASYNITSVVKDSVGDYTVTIANDFSSANYVVLLSVLDGDANTEYIIKVRTQAAGAFTIKCVEFDAGGFPDADPDAIYFACYGDL